MNMKTKHIFLFLAALPILLTSCEKVVDIDETESQLVLNGVPTADKRAFVYFANTRFFLDGSNDHPVNGAQLTLTVNGVPYTPDSVAHSKYFFAPILQAGDSLSIDITTPRGPVHAETYVPLMPDVDNFNIRTYKSPTFNFVQASFNLNDHAGVDEIYRVNVTVRDSGLHYNAWTDAYDTIDTVRNTYFIVRDQAITADNVCPYLPLGGYLYSTLMFLDRNIDGQNHSTQINILQLTDTNEVHPYLHQYMVDVQSVTPARFNYIISSSQQNNMTSFFTEAGEVRGNVSGALGVFAGQASLRFTYDTVTTTPADTVVHRCRR